MPSAKRPFLTSVVLLAAASCASAVGAQERTFMSTTPVAAMDPTVFPALERLPPAAERRSPFGSKPVPAAALSARRGGDRVFNEAQLKGVVADNQAVNVNTGMNVISEGAFAGSSGLSTVIQNSGNNVLIQNATIVNVQLK